MSIQVISAEEWRRKLAGLETPDQTLDDGERDALKQNAVDFILALREVFGDSLDRKTLWERIANGFQVSAAKAGGKVMDFVSSMLDFVQANENAVVGSAKLAAFVSDAEKMSSEEQAAFIHIALRFRKLLVLQARQKVQEDKSLLEQTGAKKVKVDKATGEIMAFGVQEGLFDE